ncbi:hypothetical protein [Amycolatopsis sp. MtRt-6]|uniref:hypothetical protein n=1 Tax=Amycolatopsis sp. MtRt-6 TaxID=2792782 RepID=UPI001A8F22CC|nr:hypothetical protein [Amycolatopsis sp. MtRt-6]
MNRLRQALDGLLGRIDTPAPIVLADVVQDNIDRMQAFAAGHGLVPAGVFTYPGHGSAGRDAHARAARDQEAALTTAVRG